MEIDLGLVLRFLWRKNGRLELVRLMPLKLLKRLVADLAQEAASRSKR